MTPLRIRMIEDMTLAGLVPGTQAVYLQAVRHLAAHFRRPPDQLSEAEVRAHLLALRERGVAHGTFKTSHGGIQFLYRRTLDRTWPLFGEKSFGRRSRGACRKSFPTRKSAPCWAA